MPEHDRELYEAKVRKMSDHELYEAWDELRKKMKKKNPQQMYDRRSRRSKPKVGSRELFCICRKPNTGEKYIACEACNDWFHPACVGLPATVNTDTYSFTCDKCRKQGNDDVYIPHSPAYDVAIDPVANRKKRKNQSNSRPSKRVKKNDPAKESFDFSTNTSKERKQVKRKRVNSEEGRKVRPRVNSKQRRPYLGDDDSDVDDIPPQSVRSRGGKIDSDDDTEDSDDLATTLADNEYARYDMPALLDEIVKCERQAERIKTQKRFQTELENLTKEAQKLRDNNMELEESKTDMEIRLFDLNKTNERLQTRLNHQAEQLENARRRHKNRVDELQKKFFLNPGAVSYRSSRDDEEKQAVEKALEEMERSRDKANFRVGHLKDKVAALEKQLEDKTLDTKLATKHKENVDLLDHLCVEKKFSSELEKHYQRTVEIVRTHNLGRSVDNRSEMMQGLHDKVKSLQAENEDLHRRLGQQRNGSSKAKKKSNAKNSSSKAKKKIKKSPASAIKSDTPSIPKTLEHTNPLYTSDIPDHKKVSVEKLGNSCMVCQSDNPENMIQSLNPKFDPTKKTEFTPIASESGAWVLSNRKYFRHHKHCLRKARVNFGAV